MTTAAGHPKRRSWPPSPGNYRPEHLFALRQNLELYDTFQHQIHVCDGEIQALLETLAAQQDEPTQPPPEARSKKKPKHNEPRFEIRTLLYRLTGVDLTQIDTIGPYTDLQLIGEIGTDMSHWPTQKHFTSWLTLAPKNKLSGGRLLSSKTQASANRAAAILRMCAMVAGRTNTALGAYYRRIGYRIGKAKAMEITGGETSTYRLLAYVALTMNFSWRKYSLSALRHFYTLKAA